MALCAARVIFDDLLGNGDSQLSRRRVPFVAPRADPDVPRLSTHLKCTLRTHVELLSPPGRPCESGVKIGVKNMTCAHFDFF